MKLSRLTTAVTACVGLLLTSSVTSALAAADDRTPLDLPSGAPALESQASPGSGGGLVRTIIGLAVVIGVIYGLYWVLKRVKVSREDRSSGAGLHAIATLSLGPNRSMQLIRSGPDVVLVGVSDQGIVPIKVYSEQEARDAGFLDPVGTEADESHTPPSARTTPRGTSVGARVGDLVGGPALAPPPRGIGLEARAAGSRVIRLLRTAQAWTVIA